MRLSLFARPVPEPPSAPSGDARFASDSWGALMAAAQDGHGGAYQRLLAQLAPWLERYFRRRLPTDEVDDAVQETLLAVHRRRHTYDPGLPLEPWLAAIARHKWIDQLRGLGRRAADQLDDDVAIDDHEHAVTSASVLETLLGRLRPAEADAIRRVKLHGWSIADAAHHSGLSPSAVKMAIHRGLARLSRLIEDTDDVA